MEFVFTVPKEYLFLTGLMQNPKIKGWAKLQNVLWDKYRLGYKALQGDLYNQLMPDDIAGSIANAVKQIPDISREGMVSKEFPELLENSEEYKTWLEQEWQNNKLKIEAELSSILRIEPPSQVFTVFVVGNLVHQGTYLGNSKIIWGHKEEWKNYSLVYLVHEYLHELLPDTFINHAVIQLISDNELRIRLNKGGRYFTCEGESVGHEYLRPIEEKILPEWKSYLKHENQTIHSFSEMLQNKYPEFINPSWLSSIVKRTGRKL